MLDRKLITIIKGGRWAELRVTQRNATHLFAERAQLFRINPVPYPLHVVPVGYNAVFHGILDLQQTSEFLGFPAYEDIPFKSTCHDPSVLRPPDTVGLKRKGKKNSVSPTRPSPPQTRISERKPRRAHYEGEKHFG